MDTKVEIKTGVEVVAFVEWYSSTSRSWHIGGKLLCRSHRNVEQRKPKSGHRGWWSHCVPKWRLAIADVTNKNLHARCLCWMFWIFDHMSLLFFVPFFGTYLDPKQKYVENLWEFPLLVHAGGVAARWDIIMFAGHGKIVVSLHDMSVEALTNFSHFHVPCSSQDKLLKGTKFLGWSSWWVTVLGT